MRVNQQQSDLLKKAGYDVPCTHFYRNHLNMGVILDTEGECEDYNHIYTFHRSAPTFHEVTDWLLTKDLYISVFPDVNMHAHKFTWFIYRRQHNQWQLWDRGGNVYDTPTAALSAAVNQALTQLLTGNELPIK